MKKLLILAMSFLIVLSIPISVSANTDAGLDVSYTINDEGNYTVTASIVDIKVDDGIVLIEYEINYDETILEFLSATVNIPESWGQYLGTEDGPEDDLCGLIEPGKYYWCLVISKTGCGITEDNQLFISLDFAPIIETDTSIMFDCLDIVGDDIDIEYIGTSKILNLKAKGEDIPENDSSIIVPDESSNNSNDSIPDNDTSNGEISNDSGISNDRENIDFESTKSEATPDSFIGSNDDGYEDISHRIGGIIVSVIYGLLLLVGIVFVCLKFNIFKKFVKDNSGVIVKFVLTHVVMSILGIMVGLALLGIEGDVEGISPIAIIGSAFTIGFMCFMHYDDMYFVAVKEGIKLRAEKKKPDLLKGLKITLIAYSPVIIVGFLAITLNAFAGNIENASGVPMFIYYLLQGSFLGLYKLHDYFGVTGYVVITMIPAIVAGTLSYVLGLKDKTLRGVFGMNVKPPYDGPVQKKNKK